MKKTIWVSIILVLMTALCLPFAAADEADFLGKPFPDFTVTDTEGNPFTLSEQLASHDAVLINFWATWCQPCRAEFPSLQDAWEKYGDRVAFIALSPYPGDSIEAVAAYREENGLTFPMGLDADARLISYLGIQPIPDTVIVDRFGNAVFFHMGAFMNSAEIGRVLDSFTGENYTASAVLKEIPADPSTRAYPVSAKRAMYVENENVRTILVHVEGDDTPYTCYVIPDETAHLRFELAAADNPETTVLVDSRRSAVLVSDLLDPDRKAYVYDQAIEGTSNGTDYHFNLGMLAGDELGAQDPDAIRYFLIRDDAYMDEIVETFRQAGRQGNITWEYVDSVQTDSTPAESGQAYTVYVVDQDRNPVPEVCINFCTDTACAPAYSDGNGIAVFNGAPDVYHLQIVDVPEGYSFDEDFEMYTDRTYGSWVLCIRKD